MIGMKTRFDALSNRVKELEKKVEDLSAMAKALADQNEKLSAAMEEVLNEGGFVQDMKDYNEGIANILTYNLEVARGKK